MKEKAPILPLCKHSSLFSSSPIRRRRAVAVAALQSSDGAIIPLRREGGERTPCRPYSSNSRLCCEGDCCLPFLGRAWKGKFQQADWYTFYSSMAPLYLLRDLSPSALLPTLAPLLIRPGEAGPPLALAISYIFAIVEVSQRERRKPQ